MAQMYFPKVIEVDPNDLSTRVEVCIKAIAQSLASLDRNTPGFELGNITFGLAILASGEVSLMSYLRPEEDCSPEFESLLLRGAAMIEQDLRRLEPVIASKQRRNGQPRESSPARHTEAGCLRLQRNNGE